MFQSTKFVPGAVALAALVAAGPALSLMPTAPPPPRCGPVSPPLSAVSQYRTRRPTVHVSTVMYLSAMSSLVRSVVGVDRTRDGCRSSDAERAQSAADASTRRVTARELNLRIGLMAKKSAQFSTAAARRAAAATSTSTAHPSALEARVLRLCVRRPPGIAQQVPLGSEHQASVCARRCQLILRSIA